MSSGITSAFVPRLRPSVDRTRGGTWWRASTRDLSTGFLNHDAFSSVGASVIRSATRRGEALSALVVRCEVAPGSVVPDPKVVMGVASALRNEFAADEVVARERFDFIVLLPSTDEVGAVEVCNRLSAALYGEGGDEDVTASVSIGASTRPPDDEGALRELLAAARTRTGEDALRREFDR
jgi:PleD family two-component response regulator